MTIRLELETTSYDKLLWLISETINCDLVPRGGAPSWGPKPPEAPGRPVEPERGSGWPLKTGEEVAEGAAPENDATESPLPEPAPGPRKRGRKKKNSTPAEGAGAPQVALDSSDAAPADGDMGTQADQPVVSKNTGSDEKVGGRGDSFPAAAPETPRGNATAGGAPTPPAAVAEPMTFDQFRERAQKAYAKLAEKLGNGNDANKMIVDVLEQAHYIRIKDVKPEHYAELAAEFDTLAEEVVP